MKFEVTETGPCRRRLAIEVEPEVVEGRVAERVREYRRTRAIPGFRPGKATEAIVRRRFGSQIRSEVLRELIPEVWGQAMNDHKLEPVNSPDFEKPEGEPGEPLKIIGVVEIKPQVEIKDYRGIEVTREVRPVTDDEVEEQIALIRRERADEVPVDRPAQNGDIVVATVQRVDPSGLPLIGKKEEGRRWELGGVGALSREMDERLAGISKGETRLLTFHYRDDLFDEARRSMEDRASVTVTEIYERQLPELDEDFLKDLGGFKTVDDFKKAVREDLERRVRLVARRKVHVQLRDRVVQGNRFDVPESMVERILTTMFREHQNDGHQHDEKEFRDAHRTEAVNDVRAALALEIIAKQENITATDDEVDREVATLAARLRTNRENLRNYMIQNGRYESMRSEVLAEKVLTYLEEQAKVEEVIVATNP